MVPLVWTRPLGWYEPLVLGRLHICMQVNECARMKSPIQKHHSCDCQNPYVFIWKCDIIKIPIFLSENPPAPACQGPPGCGASSISFFYYCCFHSFIHILLSLLSHTFLLSHKAIDPQSESPINQRLFTPLPPRLKKQEPYAPGPRIPLFFRSTGPPNPCSKTHMFWHSTPNPRGKTHTWWPYASNPCGISHTFTPIPLQYGPTGSLDGHNMASIHQANINTVFYRLTTSAQPAI
jgi:hypothetical protein